MIAVVQCIPTGKVASYGQIAGIVQGVLEQRVTAQLIGRQLSGMHRSEWSQLPRWRVVNKQGFISTIKLGDKGREQEELLRAEGIEVHQHTVSMSQRSISTAELQTLYAASDNLPIASHNE